VGKAVRPATLAVTLEGVSEGTLFLVYAEDGARLVYAGDDPAEYERRCAALAAGYAGSLVGRRRVGPEQWVVRTFFREPPTPAFIARRRESFPYGLTWEPSPPATDEPAG
jgi:hypothetical protein